MAKGDGGEMKHVVSFSGGKDSTAMLLRLLEEKYPVDDIVFFDTGWEFPEMANHVQKVQKYIGREITVLKPEISFEYEMLHKPIIRRKKGASDHGQVYRHGNGWPAMNRRWCTKKKSKSINKYIKEHHGKGAYQYIGYAADEIKRTGCGNSCSGVQVNGVERLYPLIFDWDMDERACLQYCYDRGFDWDGLYQDFARVSCFCCPLSRLGELRTVRRKHPELWTKMLKWDIDMIKRGVNKGFYGYATVHDLDRRFAQESSLYDYMQQTEQKEMMGE